MVEPLPIGTSPLLPLATPAAATESLLAQVTALDRLLAQARSELAVIRAQPAGEMPVPTVHEELGAIASQTEAATDAILDACEAMDPLTASPDLSVAAQVQAATTRIYEACGFHDLVGQRIQRVLGTLDTIETALEAIMLTLGDPLCAALSAPAIGPENEDLQLINSPQLPLIAMRQADVDRLMAGD